MRLIYKHDRVIAVDASKRPTPPGPIVPFGELRKVKQASSKSNMLNIVEVVYIDCSSIEGQFAWLRNTHRAKGIYMVDLSTHEGHVRKMQLGYNTHVAVPVDYDGDFRSIVPIPVQVSNF